MEKISVKEEAHVVIVSILNAYADNTHDWLDAIHNCDKEREIELRYAANQLTANAGILVDVLCKIRLKKSEIDYIITNLRCCDEGTFSIFGQWYMDKLIQQLKSEGD